MRQSLYAFVRIFPWVHGERLQDLALENTVLDMSPTHIVKVRRSEASIADRFGTEREEAR